jgi:phosphoribosylamine--glycine ligase
MARGRAFGALESARAFARDLAAAGRGVVIKADGLAAGKGVTVCESLPEAERALSKLFSSDPGARVVVEERLVGREASLIVLTDGRAALALSLARDHKRLRDGDEGPNTGGMGAYSPLPDLPDDAIPELVETIHLPILAELAGRGTPFVGALYAGLMLTSLGPVLLECNARFGDPEAQVLLPRLATPLGPLLLAAARGTLGAAGDSLGLADARLPVLPGAAVGIVLAAGGYPGKPRRGDPIAGLEAAAAHRALVFHAGTAQRDGHYTTDGGRVMTVVGSGPSLAVARATAERAADEIYWDGLQRRRDIAAQLPAEAATMWSVR